MMSEKKLFQQVLYVTDDKIRRGDITIENGVITHISDTETITSEEEFKELFVSFDNSILLPGVIDEHVHTREPGLTHKGDLTTESRAAAAGGVTTSMDMPNVVPQTTNLQTLEDRFALGAAHSYVNYSFYFGATNSNAHLLSQLDPTRIPAVKLFMGSSTGGMLVDRGSTLEAVFQQSTLPIMTHCEDSDIISKNLREAQALYGEDPDVIHHPEIRSREACLASTRLAVDLARKYKKHLHLAHISTRDELSLIPHPTTSRHCSSRTMIPFSDGSEATEAQITAEVCLPHLLFCDEDYTTLGTRIKCNPAIKTRADRDALRSALSEGLFTTVATDHAPHLLSEKQGGCKRAASGMPMVQFSLTAMLELMEQKVLKLEDIVALMCHNSANLFGIVDRGFIREGMKADLVVVRREPWTLNSDKIVSRCGWSPLEGRTFHWQVNQTYCNGHLIYKQGEFVAGNQHAQQLLFREVR